MTRIIAHRGFSASYPENTMLAFRRAAETGCDGIELDVQLTKDGQLVIIHDETVDRTTGGTGNVRDLRLEELRRLDASAGFAGRFGFNPVPTLSEYLDFVRDTPLWTNIELKNGVFAYPGLEERLIAALRECGQIDRVVLSSFNHQSLARCKRLSPESEIAFVIGCWMISAGAYCEANGSDYLSCRSAFLTPENREELRAHGIRAQAWTVNEAADMERLFGAEVFAILTNEPGRALRVAGR